MANENDRTSDHPPFSDIFFYPPVEGAAGQDHGSALEEEKQTGERCTSQRGEKVLITKPDSEMGMEGDQDDGVLRDGLSIGALSKSTGISIDSLRMWERRYGAPRSYRLPSGHRRYPSGEVQRLRAVNKAMQVGYRAGQVAGSTLDELQRMMETLDAVGSAHDQRCAERVIKDRSRREVVEAWAEMTRRLDDTALSREFHDHYARLGPMRFLEERAVPFLIFVGICWEQGDLSVMDEHFASERLSDFIAMQWRRLNERTPGRPYMMATLSGDLHRIGLQMASLIVALAEHRVVYLGPSTPAREILRAAARIEPAAVCLSISATPPPNYVREQVEMLREQLSPSVPLVLGGSGANAIPPQPDRNMVRFEDLSRFYEWAREMPHGA